MTIPKTIKFYELTSNSDTMEGKGYTVVRARFMKHEDAVAVCDDKRFYGRYGPMGHKLDPKFDVREVCGPIFDSAEQYWDYREDEVRRTALAKLTDLEKKALGLPL